MPYRAEKPPLPETPEQLRARIPGWGADLDPADRPSYPRERTDLETGAHWDLPEQQPETSPGSARSSTRGSRRSSAPRSRCTARRGPSAGTRTSGSARAARRTGCS